MTTESTTLWPEEIRLSKSKDSLFVKFDNGHEVTLQPNYCGLNHPRPRFRAWGWAKIYAAGKAEVTISALEPVGNYAIRISFSDGHDTGLFSWDTYTIMASVSNKCLLIIWNGWPRLVAVEISPASARQANWHALELLRAID